MMDFEEYAMNGEQMFGDDAGDADFRAMWMFLLIILCLGYGNTDINIEDINIDE